MFSVSRSGRHYSRYLHTRCVHSGIGAAPPFTDLDAASLELVRRRLARAAQRKAAPRFKYAAGAGDAAVLLLLCTVDGHASIVFEERHRRLAAHSGEACFAGGKADPQDATLVETALRETHEELGIDASCVAVLGRMGPVPNKTASLKVHPVVGALTTALDLKGLAISRDEVHRAFALPLSHFYHEKNRDLGAFRNTGLSLPVYATDKPGLRIWGLTAYILNEFLCAIGDSSNDH
ncbi:hypothetical protein GGI24_002518 [Coemansia furcata]|nr:hypothetical protein GGI24_002518 [Coemansia furcata]